MIQKTLFRFLCGAAVPVFVSACALPPATGDDDEVELAVQDDALALKLCGPSTTAPAILAERLSAPEALVGDGDAPHSAFDPYYGRYSRGGVHYVSTNFINSHITTDGCTYIKEVRLGSRVLTTSSQNGFYYFTYLTSEPGADPNQLTHVVSVQFPNLGDGRTDTVTIVVGRSNGAGTTTHSFPVVQVDAVRPKDSLATIGISDRTLYNELATSLFNMFGGSANRTVIAGNEVYGLDYSSIYVNTDAEATHFGFRFKAETLGCNPTVKVHGGFALGADRYGLFATYPDPVEASFEFGGLCQVTHLLPLLGTIEDWVEQWIAGGEEPGIVDGVMAGISSALPSVGDAAIFLHSTQHVDHEVRIHLKLPAPQLDLDVKYDAFDMDHPGTLFPADETVGVFAFGVGVNEENGLPLSADGLPNRAVNPPPIGSVSLNRPNTSLLPLPGDDVGRLLGRRSGPSVRGFTTFAYGRGCGMATTNWTRTIRFGVNDTAADAARIRSFNYADEYKVRVVFESDEGLRFAPCAAQ